jgi:hypothetical protein
MSDDPVAAANALTGEQAEILSRISDGESFSSYYEAARSRATTSDRAVLADLKLIEPSYCWPITNWSLVRLTPLGRTTRDRLFPTLKQAA